MRHGPVRNGELVRRGRAGRHGCAAIPEDDATDAIKYRRENEAVGSIHLARIIRRSNLPKQKIARNLQPTHLVDETCPRRTADGSAEIAGR